MGLILMGLTAGMKRAFVAQSSEMRTVHLLSPRLSSRDELSLVFSLHSSSSLHFFAIATVESYVASK